MSFLSIWEAKVRVLSSAPQPGQQQSHASGKKEGKAHRVLEGKEKQAKGEGLQKEHRKSTSTQSGLHSRITRAAF